MHCRSYLVNSSGDVDDDYHLIFAKAVDAYCDRRYWDAAKKRFCPQSKSTKPFLTFLGSQTFGYVKAEPAEG